MFHQNRFNCDRWMKLLISVLFVMVCVCWSCKLQGVEDVGPAGQVQAVAMQSGRRQKKSPPGGEKPDNKPGAAPPPPPAGMPEGPMANDGVGNAQATPRQLRVVTGKYFIDDCDSIIDDCMMAYRTGEICGRTVFFQYRTFDWFCTIDWLNCKLRYETWQLAYMGPCIEGDMRYSKGEKALHDVFAYTDDPWLDDVYADIGD